MQTMMMILIGGILVNNYVLARFLGICPFLGVSGRLGSAVGMGLAVTSVMVMATAVTWPIYHYLLVPNYEYLMTLVFILVIASLVQFLEVVLKKYLPALYRSLGVYLPLITTNCALLGVTILNIDERYTFGQSLVNAFGAGVGFLVAMVLFTGVRTRMNGAKLPKSFEGVPITLIAASIVSLSFMGFTGLIGGIFG